MWAALDDLFALTLTESALTRLIGNEAVNLASFLVRSQAAGSGGARWGDVELLADLLWERGGRLAETGPRISTAHPMAIRLMEIADKLSIET